ncbi:MAG: glycosyltransferase [Chitinivibrionales bacterium]|nr:glycosyltransferase [Chitinivibrionales bacterium]
MNIVYLSSEYPPETGFGGIATYTRYSALTMSRRGHRVQVISRSLQQSSTLRKAEGVTVHRIPPVHYPLPQGKLFFPIRTLFYRAIPQSLIRYTWAKAAAHTCRELARREAIDILEFPECGAEGYFISGLKATVTVARLHTPWEMVRELDDIAESLPDRIVLGHCERQAVAKARLVTSPSRALADIVRTRWSLKSVTAYPNPIAPEEFPLTKGGAWIYTGRVEKRKGVHLLLQAYRLLGETMRPPPLLLLGKPYGTSTSGKQYAQEVEELVAQCSQVGKVSWIKGVEHCEVKNYLQQSSAAIFPSLWENFPYACMEAMACGCTVIAARCGGYPEMVANRQTGLLFATGDANDLADKLQFAIENPDIARELGMQARRFVSEHFSCEKLGAGIEDMYLSALIDQTHGQTARHSTH